MKIDDFYKSRDLDMVSSNEIGASQIILAVVCVAVITLNIICFILI